MSNYFLKLYIWLNIQEYLKNINIPSRKICKTIKLKFEKKKLREKNIWIGIQIRLILNKTFLSQ